MDIFLQQIVNGLVQGSIYALVALGYTMVYGIMGLINFAHGEVVMIGTLVTITVAGSLINAGMPVALAGMAGLGASMLICMALGWGLERIAYRPLCAEGGFAACAARSRTSRTTRSAPGSRLALRRVAAGRRRGRTLQLAPTPSCPRTTNIVARPRR